MNNNYQHGNYKKCEQCVNNNKNETEKCNNYIVINRNNIIYDVDKKKTNINIRKLTLYKQEKVIHKFIHRLLISI